MSILHIRIPVIFCPPKFKCWMCVRELHLSKLCGRTAFIENLCIRLKSSKFLNFDHLLDLKLDMRRRWNQMGMDFHPGRNHGRNYYRQNQGRYQNPNHHNHWNPGYMNMGGFDHTNCPFDCNPINGNYNQPPMMSMPQNSFGRPRRFGRGGHMEFNPPWMGKEDCFVNPGNFNKHMDRNRHSRERSTPPSTSVEQLSDIFRKNRFDDNASPYKRSPSVIQRKNVSSHSQRENVNDKLTTENLFELYNVSRRNSSPHPQRKNENDELTTGNLSEMYSVSHSSDNLSPPIKRTIRADNKREHMKMPWSSDSDSDNKDDNNKGEVEVVKQEPVSKRDKQLISLIWSDESDSEDKTVNTMCKIFKFNSETLPKFDGKTIVGDEGVFEMKVFRCTFCNIICLDKEKSKDHMRTKYHYNHYKDYLINYETENHKEKDE